MDALLFTRKYDNLHHAYGAFSFPKNMQVNESFLQGIMHKTQLTNRLQEKVKNPLFVKWMVTEMID